MVAVHRSRGAGNTNVLGAALNITDSKLEQQFWRMHFHKNLTQIDVLYELCNVLIWLSILPTLTGSDLLWGKASMGVAVTQLLTMQLAPGLWFRFRGWILSSGLLLRCILQLLRTQPTNILQNSLMHQQWWLQPSSGSLDVNYIAATITSSGFCSHVLFVLCHQQPFWLQAPLLAAGALTQACSVDRRLWADAAVMNSWTSSNSTGFSACHTASSTASNISTSLAAGGVHLVDCMPTSVPSSLASSMYQQGLLFTQAVNQGFELLATGGLQLASGLWHDMQDLALLLAIRLFTNLFWGLLLPLFVAYIMEWHQKVVFLLESCTLPPKQQLQVLTTAAAVIQASTLLGLLLLTGWVLVLATSTWLLCCAVACVLVT